MSKKVTIPTDGGNPFVVILGGIKYVYKPGETVEVPDGVALEIKEWERWKNKYHGAVQPPFAAGGGGVQPDLSQNDPNAADYVKNRTHYEETTVVNEPLNITWDGDTKGLVQVPINGTPVYKISDAILTNEQIKTITETNNYGEQFVVSDNWGAMLSNGMVTPEIVGTRDCLYVRKAGVEFYGMAFPEPGIYAVSSLSYYITSITTTEPVEHTKRVVKKLEKRFLPVASATERGITSFAEIEQMLQNRVLPLEIGVTTKAQLKECLYFLGDILYFYGQRWKTMTASLYALQYDDPYSMDYDAYFLVCAPVEGFRRVGVRFDSNDILEKVEFIPMNRSLEVLSSTSGSKKVFKITVDDSGTISATEVTK